MPRITVTQRAGEDGEVELFEPWYFDSENCKVVIKENTTWDGRNEVSKVAGKFEHQRLYVTAKDRYALATSSDYSGVGTVVAEVDVEQAVSWLIRNATDPRDGEETFPQELLDAYAQREG
jgi:hypothetical protein